MAKKNTNTTTEEAVEVGGNWTGGDITTKRDVIAYIRAKAPTLFDRDPVLTGNVEKFAEEIIRIVTGK